MSDSSESEAPVRLPSVGPDSPKGTLRRPSVYDAVAGRVTHDRFIPKKLYIPSTRDTAATPAVPLTPEEALFRSAKAPTIYENEDVYNWDTRPEFAGQLPDSDLLKAIHAYCSDYYSRAMGADAEISLQSLDGSALLALGILLEESCKSILGKTGHLALLETDSQYSSNEENEEGEEEEQEDEDEMIDEGNEESAEGSVSASSGERRLHKKRKVHDDRDERHPA